MMDPVRNHPRPGSSPPPADNAAPTSATESRTARQPAPPLGGLPARPARPAAVPVPFADLQQAAYIVAREATGRPLAPPQKALMWQANESKKEVFALMPYGRGNVATDLAVTQNVGLHRVRARRLVEGALPSVGVPQSEVRIRTAGLTALAASGNCEEFANLAAHVHAARLQPGDRATVETLDTEAINHAWVLVRSATPAGGEPGSGPAAVLDAWADGPVIDPNDGGMSSGAAGPTEPSHRIDGHEARAVVAAFEHARNPDLKGQGPRLERYAASLASRGDESTAKIYAPTPVVSAAFAQAAATAMRGADPQTLRASAIAALLGAPTPPTPEQADASVDAVLGLAADLRAIHPRDLRGPDPAASGRPADAAPEDEPSARRQRMR
jgi:hypothetical protein